MLTVERFWLLYVFYVVVVFFTFKTQWVTRGTIYKSRSRSLITFFYYWYWFLVSIQVYRPKIIIFWPLEHNLGLWGLRFTLEITQIAHSIRPESGLYPAESAAHLRQTNAVNVHFAHRKAPGPCSVSDRHRTEPEPKPNVCRK